MEHARNTRAVAAPPQQARVSNTIRAALRPFELQLGRLCAAARILPAITPRNAASERARLVACVERRESPVPHWQYAPTRVPPAAFRLIEALRADATALPARALHEARLDELELELRILDAVGEPRSVRPLAARRYGSGDRDVATTAGPVRLREYARRILDEVAHEEEPRTLPADGAAKSLASIVRTLAQRAGLDVSVQVTPSLAAGAASADRTVFLADRMVGPRQALRLAVHEVLGHLVSAENGRRQPLRVLEWGTAGAFADQEGLALCLEAMYGLMDAPRLRTLAARVLATDCVHDGATFAEAVACLHRDEGFGAAEAVAVAERAYRGGGVARDASYLFGWLRLRDAVDRGACTLDELRLGRVGLDALPCVRDLVRDGWAVRAGLLPNFSRSFRSTRGGTTPLRSPPSAAASLIRLELT